MKMKRITALPAALLAAALFLAACQNDSSITNAPVTDDHTAGLQKGSDFEQDNGSHDIIYAVTAANRLLKFSSHQPDKILWQERVTGLQFGEVLLGLDFRPANGKLYAVSSNSRLYVIDRHTAAATPVGAQPFSPVLEGTSFGFDFNPTVDRIRLISNTGQNLRLHPDLGTVVAVDGRLAYAGGDRNAGRQPAAVGAAYTNPDNDPATGTTLYDLDAATDVLTIQNPPNNGVLNTIAPLDRNINLLTGFDIGPSGSAYAVLFDRSSRGNAKLVRVDLATGRLHTLGRIDKRLPITAMAVQVP
ncbi:MAG: DUF4394 domain-containing protein [candidate division KSB1 bacterium]|nr:DUF4394 domain-containing protein [candidate division KSB1 bacterium]MDZ7274428.1 DUF4394 domain-containing protein [candidate division KSB1 bacterium]MDZ7284910.1 DUF4394 domain-containing protein [candidate division KSB1 bacterium]MDZ7297669.1 DUF4394 domain-containing protein [candidate division KSB1 bacterium]MDZ7305907.1 DUF4394 domain-containing protein [candidate division KSB1 bacterium]